MPIGQVMNAIKFNSDIERLVSTSLPETWRRASSDNIDSRRGDQTRFILDDKNIIKAVRLFNVYN